MRNYDTATDQRAATARVIEVEEVLASADPGSLRASRTYLLRDEWDWRDLRDFVINEITSRRTMGGRDALREAGIFKGFVKRHGSNAEAIARYAFDRLDGVYEGTEVGVTSFCKNADPFFADPIAERLAGG